ncbi:MAG: 4-hydroxy-tetrahydrodipicolinate reductase [Candidatus Omnitrophica bacterium]|nr:4-hydroxy-tetrahydrodipicolinate reductase [Candidatus Omnitrophota bacterium]
MTPPPARIRLVVSGCCGRMGSLIAEEAAKDSAHFDLAGALEHPGHPQVGKPYPAKPGLKVSDDLPGLLQQADLLMEFTTPEATLEHAGICAEAQVAMIIGTTGLSPEQTDRLFRETDKKIPIFISPNMSIGIFILRKMIGHVSEELRKLSVPIQEMKLSEAHHAKKKDRPSGTAKQLAKEIGEATGRVIPENQISVRRDEEFDVAGVHTVTFELGAEKLLLTHEATDRRLFAQGALWVARHFRQVCTEPKVYGMDDFMAQVPR